MATDRTLVIITAIIVPIITIFIGSDVLIAEFLTDFHVEPIDTLSGWVEHRASNIGLVQADNVILTIFANVTIDEFKSVCPEGNLYRINDQTLAVKFQRMSPHMGCLFSMNVSEPADFGFIITSDNRSLWILNFPLPSAITVLSYLVLLAILESILIIILWPKLIIWYSQLRKFSIDLTESQPLDWRSAVRQFVFREYGVKIDMTDALILGFIHMRKTTVNQLKKYTNLSWIHVRFRVWKMRQLDLLSKESMIPDAALTIFFESEFQYSGDYSRSPHDMYKYLDPMAESDHVTYGAGIS